LFSEVGLKELSGDNGTFLSGRKLEIDGVDAGEVVLKVKKETPVATVNIYLIQYYLVYKDKMINLSFAAGALTEIQARELFYNYKQLFQGLTTNTVLLSKWD
jgi:hypothetical protein